MLFEWLRETFIEMHERDDKPGGAVRLKAIRRSWKDDSSGSPMIRGMRPQNQRAPLHAQGIPGELDHPVDLGDA
jgi:hypothetical protein